MRGPTVEDVASVRRIEDPLIRDRLMASLVRSKTSSTHIARLFRCIHTDPTLTEPPFTEEQVRQIRAGVLPAGTLQERNARSPLEGTGRAIARRSAAI